MDNFDENEIGKLLRLKKYEQPPPGYFENFLHEFHRRQRDELLRQPVWSVLWQRLSDSLFRLNIPSLTSYPAAVAARPGLRGGRFAEGLSGAALFRCRDGGFGHRFPSIKA